MPVKHRVRRRRQRGAGFMDWVRKGNNFLKNTKLISTVGNALGSVGVPYASKIAGVAGRLGYGRRRMGSGIRLAGGRRLR